MTNETKARQKRIQRTRAFSQAVVDALPKVEEYGRTTPYDIAIAIRVELDKAGLQIVWRRGHPAKTLLERFFDTSPKDLGIDD